MFGFIVHRNAENFIPAFVKSKTRRAENTHVGASGVSSSDKNTELLCFRANRKRNIFAGFVF